MSIYCENELCIYQSGSHCSFGFICLDACGICTNCFVVTIPEPDLTQYKKEALQKDQYNA